MRFSRLTVTLWSIALGPTLLLISLLAIGIVREFGHWQDVRDELDKAMNRQGKVAAQYLTQQTKPQTSTAMPQLAINATSLELMAESLRMQAETLGLWLWSPEQQEFVTALGPGQRWPMEPVYREFLSMADPIIVAWDQADKATQESLERSTDSLPDRARAPIPLSDKFRILELEFRHAAYHRQSQRAFRALQLLARVDTGRFEHASPTENPAQQSDLAAEPWGELAGVAEQSAELARRARLYRMVGDALQWDLLPGDAMWDSIAQSLSTPIQFQRRVDASMAYARMIGVNQIAYPMATVRFDLTPPRIEVRWNPTVDVSQIAGQVAAIRARSDLSGTDPRDWFDQAAARLLRPAGEPVPSLSPLSPLIGNLNSRVEIPLDPVETDLLIVAMAKLENQRRLLIAAIAVKRHRMSTGDWPASLADLQDWPGRTPTNFSDIHAAPFLYEIESEEPASARLTLRHNRYNDFLADPRWAARVKSGSFRSQTAGLWEMLNNMHGYRIQ